MGRRRWPTYNGAMPASHPLVIGLALLSASLAAAAQAPAAPATPAIARAQDPALEPSRSNQTIERIRTEDGGSRIDELRVGGQTQSIVVQPKCGRPICGADRARVVRGSGISCASKPPLARLLPLICPL